MATVKKYLDYEGLSSFKTLIQTWANGAEQLGYKKFIKSNDGNRLYLFTDPSATDASITNSTPYVELGGGSMAAQLTSLASALGATWDASANSGAGAYVLDLDNSFPAAVEDAVDAINNLKSSIDTLNAGDTTPGSVAKAIKDAIGALDVSEFAIATSSNGVVTIKGIKEEDGLIAVGTNTANDITLAKVATTGAAEDVSYSATIGGVEVSDVDSAIDTLATYVGAASDEKTIYMASDSTTGTDYAAIYRIYQGSTGNASTPDNSELVGTINIPKDQFLDEADLVDITFDNSGSTPVLKDGSTEVTALILGTGVTPTSTDAGKYIKLVFAIQDGSAAKNTIYISVKSLVDVYTGGTNSEVTVAVDASTNVITAAVNKIAGTKVVYKPEYTDSTTGNLVAEETVVDALNNIGSIPLTGTNSVASLFSAS